jgi:chromosome segregation ATPase
MSRDFTKGLPGASPFEKRLLAELGALRSEVADLRTEVAEIRSEVAEIRTQQVAMAENIAVPDQRLTSLEEKVDSRLKETRPIWEAVRAQIEKLDEKFNLFIRDLYDIRGDISLHGKRPDILRAQGAELRLLSIHLPHFPPVGTIPIGISCSSSI